MLASCLMLNLAVIVGAHVSRELFPDYGIMSVFRSIGHTLAVQNMSNSHTFVVQNAYTACAISVQFLCK